MINGLPYPRIDCFKKNEKNVVFQRYFSIFILGTIFLIFKIYKNVNQKIV